jgi:hypothetical protein
MLSEWIINIFSISIGFLGGLIYDFLYGMIFSFPFIERIKNKLPKTLFDNYLKIYLIILWITKSSVSTLVSFRILILFHLNVTYIFILLVCLEPGFLMYSKKLSRPEIDMGYFNLIPSLELSNENVFMISRKINKIKSWCKIIGIFISLLIIRFLFNH